MRLLRKAALSGTSLVANHEQSRKAAKVLNLCGFALPKGHPAFSPFCGHFSPRKAKNDHRKKESTMLLQAKSVLRRRGRAGGLRNISWGFGPAAVGAPRAPPG